MKIEPGVKSFCGKLTLEALMLASLISSGERRNGAPGRTSRFPSIVRLVAADPVSPNLLT